MSTDPLPTSQRERLAESLRLSRRHHVLNELLRITTSTVEISEVFDRVGEQVQQLVDHDRLSIALHRPGEDYVEVYASLAEGRPLVFEEGARLPLNEVPQGEVILTGRPVFRKNLPDDGVYPLEAVIARDAGLRSAMLVPLESRNHAFGSLNFGSRHPNRYSEKDLEVAQEIADHLAVVVEHAWLNKQLVRQAEESACLTAISTAVSGALNVPELLDLALERLIALTGMEGGAALLIDDATQCLTLAAERNLPPAAKDWLEQHPIPVGEFIPGLTAQRCEMFVVKNAKDDERELPLLREMGVGTHICIPLAVGGQALGVFGMTDAERRSFSCSELNLFTASGELLGAGVERARLFESKAMLAGRLQTLNELMRIAVSTLDINEAFTRIELQVRQLIDLDRFSIALRPAGKDHLEMYAVALESQRTFATGTPSRFQTLETPMGEVTLTGRPLIRRNPADFTYPLEFEMEQAGGYRSAMFVPLKSRGRVIGSLNMGSNKEDGFSEAALQTAQTIAEHLSVVVEHALLYQESKDLTERLQTFNELMRIAVSTLDINEVFDRVGEQVKRLIDYTRLSIAIHPPGEDFIEMYAVTTEGQSVFPKGMRLPLDQTPMGEAILTGNSILRRTSDAFTYPIEFEMSKTIGSSSFMFGPLKSKGRVIGSLNLASRPDAKYSEEELSSAQEIADHLAVVLEHAMLFEESKQAEEASRRLNKQLEDTNRHKTEFLANMSHELRPLLTPSSVAPNSSGKTCLAS